MMIFEAMKSRAEGEGVREDGIHSKLFNLANYVVENVEEHLKLIISQLPEFDIHDSSHSKKVILNIEALMSKDIINKLSGYELFLLYLSAYLHDCAMALPEWEIRLLKLTEGTENLTDERIENPLANDFKPPFKLSESLSIIEERKNQLYISFDIVKNYIFAPDNEDEFKRDLAERLIEYQEFRNGFTEELKKIKKTGSKLRFLEFSDLIRYEYVRQTHAQRSEKYIMNLSKLFCERLDGTWGNGLARDLANICKSHGENYDFVMDLEVEASYFGIETANIQFISTMLRLGDSLHFSFDRAPKSLLSEKMIESKESIKHWKAKLQGLNYSIGEVDGNGRVKIKYMAYCEEPSEYYFIQDYLNWADDELNNYFKFIYSLSNSVNTKKLSERYVLNIAQKIDRTQLKYNEHKFIPVPNARFTLNQNKILELLMGVGLYKDKYLCLREIYQNSLDACRCMLSSLSTNNISTKGYIEFGLGESFVYGVKKRYLYCLDNGVGMTKDIIERFFLNIGNSYYNSREFYRKSAKWNNIFKPTSQFGIGILSCFMIGSRIEITTKALGDDMGEHNAIRFSIDGPHENFYYMKVDKLDLERLGPHGTYLKVFLSDDDSLNSDEISQLPLIIHGQKNPQFCIEKEHIYKVWEKNIYRLLFKSIGIVDERIDVSIKFSNGRNEKLISWNEPLNLANIKDDDIKSLYSDYRFLDGYLPYIDFLRCSEFIDIKCIAVRFDNIEYYTILSLPKPEIPTSDYRVLNLPKTIVDKMGSILVDGISVNNPNVISFIEFDDRRDIAKNGILNFLGSERPQLSVDRNSITSISDSLKDNLKKIKDVLSKKLVEEVSEHNKKYNIRFDSSESKMIWDYLLNKFSSMSHAFIKHLTSGVETDIILEDLSRLLNDRMTSNKFIRIGNIRILDFNFKELSRTSELLLLGKLVQAKKIEVEDTKVSISNIQFHIVNYPNEFSGSSRKQKPIIIKADRWDGRFEQYDLVSNIWPLVPERLFDKFLDKYEVVEVSTRTKFTACYSNSICAIAELHSALINPKFGISEMEHDTIGKKKNFIGKCERMCNNFSMFEVNSHEGELEDRKCYFVYAFISPSKLTEEEKIKLESYKEEDPVYYKGVLDGWSILFLGNSAETIILPGIVNRSEIVKKIRSSFWTLNDKMKYYFLDGSKVSDLK